MSIDRPTRWPWPPLVYGTLLVASTLLDMLVPWELPLSPRARLSGFAIVAAGLALDVWAMLTLMRARTTIMPHRGSVALVTDGPYRFSRNPIYLGNTALLAGVGVLFGSWWVVAAAFLATGIVWVLAVRREEAHLAARFGPVWDDYARRVNRWI